MVVCAVDRTKAQMHMYLHTLSYTLMPRYMPSIIQPCLPIHSPNNAMKCPISMQYHPIPCSAIPLDHEATPSPSSALATLLFLSLFLASFSAFLSSAVGTGGLSSIDGPKGAIIDDTTWWTCFETRQPGWMAMMSPTRR